MLVLDNMDVLDPAVTCEILNCLSKAPSWVRVLVFGRPTSELQEALNGADARLVEWDAEADAADVANACRQLVASSAPRAWLEDSGVSGLNKEASKILIERVSGSYAYLGGIMR